MIRVNVFEEIASSTGAVSIGHVAQKDLRDFIAVNNVRRIISVTQSESMIYRFAKNGAAVLHLTVILIWDDQNAKTKVNPGTESSAKES